MEKNFFENLFERKFNVRSTFSNIIYLCGLEVIGDKTTVLNKKVWTVVFMFWR